MKEVLVLDLGHIQKLKISKILERGAYLEDGHGEEILLPMRELPDAANVGDELEVFIYLDSEDRKIATLDMPFAMVGEFALLRVKSLERVGAFLDWGLQKDLFMPFSEQTRELKVGQNVVVHLYIDNSERIAASMRLDRFISKESAVYEPNQPVDLFVAMKTDLGFKAVVNGKHWGMLFSNEVFERLEYGQKLKGYIKQVRPDGKIDLMLQPLGNKGALDLGQKILDVLKAKGGFMPLTEKTPPETIYDLFGVSKKKYKMALGGLYKKRVIAIEENGIRLLKS